jgi:hypothetical protein
LLRLVRKAETEDPIRLDSEAMEIAALMELNQGTLLRVVTFALDRGLFGPPGSGKPVLNMRRQKGNTPPGMCAAHQPPSASRPNIGR